MPLTPRFELSQTDAEVVVAISVPTVRVTNIEVLLEESTLHFHASPYLLKLNFSPHQFAEDSQGIVSAHYDPSLQTIRIPLVKANPGTDWPNLDLTARLLQPKEIAKHWLHEVQDSQDNGFSDARVMEDSDDMPMPENSSGLVQASTGSPLGGVGPGYGFGDIFHNIFTDYCRSGMAQEMLQLSEPESTPASERTILRMEREQDDFDSDRYIQDIFIEEDYLYPMVMEFEPFWMTSKSTRATNMEQDQSHHSKLAEAQQLDGRKKYVDLAQSMEKQLRIGSDSSSLDDNLAFTSEEKLQLSTIPYPLIPESLLQPLAMNKTEKINASTKRLWIGMLDLLVPFVYDHLTTMGDPTVESAWTITVLSGSLSWLDPPSGSLYDAVVSSTRRMLIYPYWRNWDFALYVWKSTIKLLKSGVRAVVKALLLVRSSLHKSECYYVGNKLFVDPYLYWLQNVTSENYFPSPWIDSLQYAIDSADSKLKHDIGLGLDEAEKILEERSDESESDDETHEDFESNYSTSDSTSVAEENGVVTQSIDAPQDLDILIRGERSTPNASLLDNVVGQGDSVLNFVTNEKQQNELAISSEVNLEGKKSKGGILIEEIG